MEDIIGTKDIIEKIIKMVGTERRRLEGLGNQKAETEAEYKKALAIAMAQLLRGKEMPLDDEVIQCKTQTNLKGFAEGLCHKELAAKLVAENAYKACVVNLECLRANLNANQSIYRHLDVGGGTG